MRSLFRSLTLRGRSLLAAGVTTGLSAVVIGEDDLLKLAVVLVALPLLAAVYLAWMHLRVQARHTLSQRRVPVGEPVEVDIEVSTRSRVPAGTLLCEDEQSPGLGPAPRVTFRSGSTRTGVRLHHTTTPTRRGQHAVGPVTLAVTDPFGLAERVAGSGSGTTLLGLPPMEPVPSSLVETGRATGGQSQAQLLSGRGEDDMSVREHTPGDGLRKVHWRTSARMGKLMIRREEQLQESRAVVFLDDRTAAHRGPGRSSSYERAVSLTASVGTALLGAGYRIRLFQAGGEVLHGGGTWSPLPFLDRLALAAPTARRDLTPGFDALRAARDDGLLVAVLGDVTRVDVEALVAHRAAARGNVAVLLDVVSFGSGALTLDDSEDPRAPGETGSTSDGFALRARHRETAAYLRSAGWWVVELDAATPLADGVGSPDRAERVTVGVPTSVPAGSAYAG